ncbi:S-adenosyl-L-methionine-dependent methyltransferase [Viridothelium virens]|uniref:S-adenosyl-L-methionine-dependent methyltransferase n=1 Tax=Viridothelium virens TaxID=1048519 RepID=A0A6A6GW84_VIRVR|nr:S-adenosyl-L-methionine-dependent methyltransferase [Viridothelium virens]
MAEQLQPTRKSSQPSADPPRSASLPRDDVDRDVGNDETSPDPAVTGDFETGNTVELLDNSSIGDSAVDLPDDDSRFSDLGKDSYASSFLSSILSEAEDYYWDNGRRYHAHGGGRYLLPNDETELDREDMKHHEMMLLTSGRLHFSPLPPDPQKILDLGTGTGIWAMEIADQYPSAEVIGTDISPVQPKWVPPNLSFEVDDLELDWLYRPDSFDLVNIRFMFLAIRDFGAVLRQAYRAAKPGGWVELTELALRPEALGAEAVGRSPDVVFRWLELLKTGAEKRGYDYHVQKRFRSLLAEAGFEEIREEVLEVPWGPWHREKRLRAVGFWHMQQLTEGLQGITMHTLSKGLGWAPQEVELFLVDLRKDLSNLSFQLLDHCHVVYGRKRLR